jgi:hypothetical protein
MINRMRLAHLRTTEIAAVAARIPFEAHVFNEGLPTTGLLAQALVAKCADHLPMYRQETIFERAGMRLSCSTLAQWVGACGVQLQPLVDALKSALLTRAVLHNDQTPVTLLKPGSGKTHRAYLWIYGTTAFDPIKGVVFDFAETRTGQATRLVMHELVALLHCGLPAVAQDVEVGSVRRREAEASDNGCSHVCGSWRVCWLGRHHLGENGLEQLAHAHAQNDGRARINPRPLPDRRLHERREKQLLPRAFDFLELQQVATNAPPHLVALGEVGRLCLRLSHAGGWRRPGGRSSRGPAPRVNRRYRAGASSRRRGR